MLKLYYSPGACSLAAHIALEESKADFEASRVTIADGDNARPGYLAVNPRGFVPALEADGTVITENVAVLTYIARRFPEAHLLPFDRPLDLARAFQQMAFLSSSLHIAFAQVWRPHRFTEDRSVHPQIVEGGRRRILGFFAEIEDRLASSAHLAGAEMTLADPYVLLFFRWGNRIGLEMSWPHWAAHSRKMLERPAVQRALAREGLDAAEFLPKEHEFAQSLSG
jgi:glutathione S-transferase